MPCHYSSGLPGTGLGLMQQNIILRTLYNLKEKFAKGSLYIWFGGTGLLTSSHTTYLGTVNCKLVALNTNIMMAI